MNNEKAAGTSKDKCCSSGLNLFQTVTSKSQMVGVVICDDQGNEEVQVFEYDSPPKEISGFEIDADKTSSCKDGKL